MKVISMVSGFITNSSSVIHFFDMRLLEDTEVSEFFDTYGIHDGILGDDLWYRSQCASLLIGKEMKQDAQDALNNMEYSSNDFDLQVEDENIGVVIYGDEYTSFASELSFILDTAAAKLKNPALSGPTVDYN
jgi:hypothetical protein